MGRPRTTPKKRRFGNIHQLPSGRWRARYRDRRNGEQVTEIFDSPGAADDWLATQQVAMATGTYVNPTRGKTKFSVLADEWKKSASAGKKNTISDYIGVLDSRVLPYWKNWSVADITPLDVRKWITSQESEFAQATRNNRRTVLSLVLRAAVEGRYISANPCEGIGAGVADNDPFEAVFLTPAQVHELAAEVRAVMLERHDRDSGYDLACLVAGFVGLRAGEVWALRARSFDASKGILRVTRSTRLGMETLPKAHERRAVPVPPEVADALAAFIEASGRKPSDRIFQSFEGFDVHHSNWSRDYFRPARRRVGFVEPPRFHDLRHTCATIWFDSGASAEIVARVLGDKVETIRRHYEHVYPDAFHKFTTNINEVVAKAMSVGNGADVSRSCHTAEIIDLMSATEIAE